MRENIDIFDFQRTDEQMTRITDLDTGKTLSFDHHDLEWVTRLGNRRID
jgi:2,5-diketo-D-gluconate reductase A